MKYFIIYIALFLSSCAIDRKKECELSDQELTEYARSLGISKETAIEHCIETQRYVDSVNAKQ